LFGCWLRCLRFSVTFDVVGCSFTFALPLFRVAGLLFYVCTLICRCVVVDTFAFALLRSLRLFDLHSFVTLLLRCVGSLLFVVAVVALIVVALRCAFCTLFPRLALLICCYVVVVTVACC